MRILDAIQQFKVFPTLRIPSSLLPVYYSSDFPQLWPVCNDDIAQRQISMGEDDFALVGYVLAINWVRFDFSSWSGLLASRGCETPIIKGSNAWKWALLIIRSEEFILDDAPCDGSCSWLRGNCIGKSPERQRTDHDLRELIVRSRSQERSDSS